MYATISARIVFFVLFIIPSSTSLRCSSSYGPSTYSSLARYIGHDDDDDDDDDMILVVLLLSVWSTRGWFHFNKQTL